MRYREQVFAARKSVLDLLDEFPSCAPPFEAFLDLLPPLRPRYYSISSSPLVSADTCSITVGVLEAPARSGHGVFKGVCSNYLAGAADRCHGLRLHPQAHHSVSPAREPAPADDHGRSRHGRRAVPRLPSGARGAEASREFPWASPSCSSAAAIRCRTSSTRMSCGLSRRPGSRGCSRAFSREPGKPKTYVQQAIQTQSEEVWRLLQQEAVVFVCGEASRMAPEVRQAFVERVPAAHWHHGRRREGLAHRTGGEPPLSRGYLGVRDLVSQRLQAVQELPYKSSASSLCRGSQRGVVRYPVRVIAAQKAAR